MGRSPRRIVLALALASFGLPAGLVHAQFGYQLPKDDFVWNWGRMAGEGGRNGFDDISVRGNEAGFSCELTAKSGLSGRLSPSDIRALEEELRSRMDFIYAVATYMNEYERQNLIDWARLSCEKFEPEPSTPEEKAARESKAKEKMQREIERRRARDRD